MVLDVVGVQEAGEQDLVLEVAELHRHSFDGFLLFSSLPQPTRPKLNSSRPMDVSRQKWRRRFIAGGSLLRGRGRIRGRRPCLPVAGCTLEQFAQTAQCRLPVAPVPDRRPAGDLLRAVKRVAGLSPVRDPKIGQRAGPDRQLPFDRGRNPVPAPTLAALRDPVRGRSSTIVESIHSAWGGAKKRKRAPAPTPLDSARRSLKSATK